MDYLFTNVILPLIVGGLGAYAYPRLEAYLKNRPLTVRQRKIKVISEEYKKIKFLRDNPNIFILQCFRGLFRALIGFVVLIGWGFVISIITFAINLTGAYDAAISTAFLVSIITGVLLARPVVYLRQLLDRMKKVLSYHKYAIDTGFALMYLEFAPEDVLEGSALENWRRLMSGEVTPEEILERTNMESDSDW